jgi:hypothetical protein
VKVELVEEKATVFIQLSAGAFGLSGWMLMTMLRASPESSCCASP